MFMMLLRYCSVSLNSLTLHLFNCFIFSVPLTFGFHTFNLWFQGNYPTAEHDVTLGHEFCGIVMEIGPAVRNVKVGSKVTVDPYRFVLFMGNGLGNVFFFC